MSNREQHHTPPASGTRILRRGTDRTETWIGWLLIVLTFLGTPSAALGTHAYVSRSSLRVVHSEQLTRRPATARLLRDTPPVTGTTATNLVDAPVRIDRPGRAPYDTNAPFPADEHAGTTTRVWVDVRTGHTVPPPLTQAQADRGAAMAAALAGLSVPFCSLVAWTSARWLLDDRRYKQWDAEWEAFEPRWSRKFGHRD
ncbi:hypothetical protein [Streptomyces sp. ICBB 8177]|uniref:Rv1733c family protein n=1 Tax=Streptomyces sp. ICBB 8177 TaxID=563922 RepID=UPI000D67E821|nr:hypothetical protein [Streptomyces sp. ICBB 8177]PWI44725.1 hypothetical protein CK485_05765 [Streptomyces sp. ICBB 8177]